MKNIALFLLLTLSILSCKKEDIKLDNEETVIQKQEEITGDFTKYGVKEGTVFKPLSVGQSAPDFILNDVTGEPRDLKEILKSGPVALVFYRGNWCPHCNKHLAALEAGMDRLSEYDVQLVAISPETPENAAKMVEKTNTSATVLIDQHGDVMKAYGVSFELTDALKDRFQTAMDFDFETEHASGKAELPVPATYLLDDNGKIIYRHFEPAYNERSTVDDLLAALE